MFPRGQSSKSFLRNSHFKMMRNLFRVISVKSHFSEIAMLKFIREPTLVRNLFHVKNVQSHFHKIAILKSSLVSLVGLVSLVSLVSLQLNLIRNLVEVYNKSLYNSESSVKVREA